MSAKVPSRELSRTSRYRSLVLFSVSLLLCLELIAVAVAFVFCSEPNPSAYTWGKPIVQTHWDTTDAVFWLIVIPLVILLTLLLALGWLWKRLLLILAAISLFLLILNSVGWALSYHAGMSFASVHRWHRAGGYEGFDVQLMFQRGGMRGGIVLMRDTKGQLGNPDLPLRLCFRFDSKNPIKYPIRRPPYLDITGKADQELGLGFAYHNATNRPGSDFHWHPVLLVVPCWFVDLVLCILPGVYCVLRLRNRNKVQSGHCAHCGYDLRASTIRCPECGVPFSGNVVA